MSDREGRLRLGLLLAFVATALRVAWALSVPTIPVGDFAMYRESANYLVEHGQFDSGFVYMPGLVFLLAALQALGGEIAAAKVMGALFGGLATLPLFLLTAGMLDEVRVSARGSEIDDGPKQRRGLVATHAAALAASPSAFLAGALYAVWPAGISLASVIGTDIPAAALLLLALACLVGWGPRRPVLAAVTFGAATGLGAYFRAVALPLTALSAGYWLACRVGMRRVVLRTGLAVVVTMLVLAPWAARNLASEGDLTFTDHHGGITALMGSYPNTEGTYARSLNIMFKELTGRTFLSLPHRETDRLAYDIAKGWMTLDPLWTAGMVALRIERLFAKERGLLYWSIYRPGVLPPRAAAWFGQHRAAITGVTDLFYFFFVVCVAAGIAFSIAEKRWLMFLPIGCAALLAAAYALFVAEPRYRLTTEVLLFPVMGVGMHRLSEGIRRLVRRLRPIAEVVPASSDLTGDPSRRGGLLTIGILMGLTLAGFAIVDGGRALREGHRWAVTLWRVDGQARLATWRALDDARPSPVHGTADGVRLDLGARVAEVGAEVIVAAEAWRHARWRVRATLEWSAGFDPKAHVAIGPLTIAAGTSRADGELGPQAGPMRLPIRLSAPRSGAAASVVIRDVVLESVTAGL